ncbi:MAG TPA: tRNA (adenosine(37)-N6)-dimethylallyltransferase MiaA [Polyangiaceae bacterium]|nr:tRNA (adenosine(37)-N6)-dimethylallyltransferase MiaA [Polyangiaceae bacterium]
MTPPARLAPVIRTVTEIAAPTPAELLVVVGPTASGKTALSLELAERFGGEIVGADSVQIYRRFDLGSAKPTAEERARVPHHVIDVADPLEPMDAGRFVELADAAIRDVRARGKVPIVVGGTFLWVKALVSGLAVAAPRDDGVRARHAEIAHNEGRSRIHAMLAAVDPDAARRLAENDLVRTSRALEVFELTGKPMSEWQREHAFGDRRYEARLVGVHRERDELDRRIEARTAELLSRGFVDEVRALLADGYAGARAMGSVGYREVKAHLEGAIEADALHREIVKSTRVFVRRQRTWLRDADVSWLVPPERALP